MGEPPVVTRHREPGVVARALALPCIGAILLYRVTLSPVIGRACRFEPTCSRYGLGAYRGHGAFWGTVLTARRVLRCHPLARGGYDPVPINEAPGGGRARGAERVDSSGRGPGV